MIAWAIGWLDLDSAIAASLRTSSSVKPSRETTFETLNFPCVRVPVLSNIIVLTLDSSSRYLPPLIRMPLRIALVNPISTVTGVEITRALGQAITSTIRAL